mgnify:CR=1 FL=1
MTPEQIDAKIVELKASRDRFIAEANRQIGFFQGQIELLEQLKAEQVTDTRGEHGELKPS